MRGIVRCCYMPHLAQAIFLGLVIAFGIDVKLAHSQTKDAQAFTAQFTSRVDTLKRYHWQNAYLPSVRNPSAPIIPMLRQC
jgi:hypothetical protein